MCPNSKYLSHMSLRGPLHHVGMQADGRGFFGEGSPPPETIILAACWVNRVGHDANPKRLRGMISRVQLQAEQLHRDGGNRLLKTPKCSSQSRNTDVQRPG
jgi:hypothetical protein